MIDAQFRLIRFDLVSGPRWIGVAWNYDVACLVSTRDHESYIAAREDLGRVCDTMGVRLRWFDGEYRQEGGMLLPLEENRP